MSIRIVGDSCLEFPEELKAKVKCVNVPLTLLLDDKSVRDDSSFDQKSFLRMVEECKGVPRSACPSPESYMSAYDGEEDWVFVITISADLSGSYNSAVLGASLYEEEHDNGKKIYVFNSKSASGGEAQVALKIQELYEQGEDFDSIVEKTLEHIDKVKTYFVLESLEVFRKNGRLSKSKAFAANMLNLKPVCVGVNGVIEPASIQRGIKKALLKMVEVSLEGVTDTKERTLIINHCNCRERAAGVLADFVSKAEFKKTMILDTNGVSSLYASDGGVIVSF